MMDDAKIAFQGELMLAGWSETHTGGAKVTFWLSDAEDLEVFRTMTVKKGNTAGQRFAVVMVEIGEDEKPVTQAISTQCALTCKSLGFQQYVQGRLGFTPDSPEDCEDQAKCYVYYECGIKSRKELDTNGVAALGWRQILADYRAHLSSLGEA